MDVRGGEEAGKAEPRENIDCFAERAHIERRNQVTHTLCNNIILHPRDCRGIGESFGTDRDSCSCALILEISVSGEGFFFQEERVQW